MPGLSDRLMYRDSYPRHSSTVLRTVPANAGHCPRLPRPVGKSGRPLRQVTDNMPARNFTPIKRYTTQRTASVTMFSSSPHVLNHIRSLPHVLYPSQERRCLGTGLRWPPLLKSTPAPLQAESRLTGLFADNLGSLTWIRYGGPRPNTWANAGPRRMSLSFPPDR